jgi:transcriptional regulator with XRE-family HTH domain
MSSEKNEYTRLFSFKNEKERINFMADRIQLDILARMSDIMKKKNISRSDVAEKLNVSKSFVSQLFSCDKRLNLKTLAQLEQVLGADFHGDFLTADSEQEMILDYSADSSDRKIRAGFC